LTVEEFLAKHGADKREDLSALLAAALENYIRANEKTKILYGREFREDVDHCVHSVPMGNHCHKCPQCNCPNKGKENHPTFTKLQ